MIREAGFSLVEILVFLIVTALMMTTFFLSGNTALRNAPSVHQQWIAMQVARGCMEWFLDQRRLNGYTALTCPSTPSASACIAPSGFSISNSVSCTTWNSDTHYKTITVTVSGLASATLSTQVGEY
jgi:hypothetical protein